MNNKDYTNLYNTLLIGINKYDSGDNLSLVNKLKEEGVFIPFIDKYGEIRTGKEITRALINMKDDALIRATTIPIKLGQYIINIDGLTTAGHNYVSVIQEPKVWRKVKDAIREEGVPITPASVSKFIGKLFF